MKRRIKSDGDPQTSVRTSAESIQVFNITSFVCTWNHSFVLNLTVICAGILGDRLIWETKGLKPDPACPEAVCLFFSSSFLVVCVGGASRVYGCGPRGMMLFVTVLSWCWGQLKEVSRFMMVFLRDGVWTGKVGRESRRIVNHSRALVCRRTDEQAHTLSCPYISAVVNMK